MRGRQTATAYCQNAACQASNGITSHYTGDTWESPGWWEPEECPHCSGRLLDERVDAETITSSLIDELRTAGLLDESTPVDEHALLAAIQAELKRQASERFNKRYELHEQAKALLSAPMPEFATELPF